MTVNARWRFFVPVLAGVAVLVWANMPGYCEETEKDPEPEKEKPKELVWHNFADGIKLADKTKKYVLIDCYTTWCEPCKMMDKYTYTDKELKEILLKHFVLIKVNIEDRKKMRIGEDEVSGLDIARALRIAGVPNTVFVQPDGKVIISIPGMRRPRYMKKVALDYILTGKYKTTSFRTFAREAHLD